MDSFNDYVTGLNSQVPTETTIYDANYSWATTNIAEKATDSVAVNTTSNTTALNTQASTLESGNDINLRIEKLKKKAMTEYLLLTASLGLVAYYVFKNK